MAIPGLPGDLIIYQGHVFALKGHLCEPAGSEGIEEACLEDF